MQTVAEARRKVDDARSDSELQGALTELAAALYEVDADESVRVAERSIAVAEGLGDSLAAAWARHNRGWALNSLGRLEEALADQISALSQFEIQRDFRGVANTLLAIGDIHGEQARLPRQCQSRAANAVDGGDGLCHRACRSLGELRR